MWRVSYNSRSFPGAGVYVHSIYWFFAPRYAGWGVDDFWNYYAEDSDEVKAKYNNVWDYLGHEFGPEARAFMLATTAWKGKLLKRKLETLLSTV